MMPRDRRREAGFTILEVLVALVVTGLAVGAAFHLFGTAFEGHARTERITAALLIAESRLAESGAVEPLSPGIASGRINGYDWRREVREYREGATAVDEGLPVRAYEVAVTVSWTGPGADSLTLTTLRLRARRRDE